MVRRFFPEFEIRAERQSGEDGEESRKIVGHAAVFNRETIINGWWGKFREKIAPGAFSQSIGEDDVRSLWNHDSNIVLGRSRPDREDNTLRMEEDETGLFTETDPPSWADNYVETIDRGDVTQMSFAFQILDEKYEKGNEEAGELDLRTILRVKLFDVSPVTYPAYEDTDVGVNASRADDPNVATYVEWRAANGDPVPQPPSRASVGGFAVPDDIDPSSIREAAAVSEASANGSEDEEGEDDPDLGSISRASRRRAIAEAS